MASAFSFRATLWAVEIGSQDDRVAPSDYPPAPESAQAFRIRGPLPIGPLPGDQDMEFVQFHPTGIRGLGILISEAARGEGGFLRNRLGERFMERYAPAIKDLAPRDIVSRAILREIQEGRGIDGSDYVHLDITHLGATTIKEKLWEISSFASIYSGVNPLHEPIPVQPTCHYMMGGIPTDGDGQVLKDAAGTPVSGLFAAGECACVSVQLGLTVWDAIRI